MESAFLLITCEHNKDDDVFAKLLLMSEIKEVVKVFGAYDLIVTVEAKSANDLQQKIMSIVTGVIDIRSTLTLTSTA